MYGYFFEREDAGSSYTDLATERREADTKCEGVDFKRELGLFGVWERIKITSEAAEKQIGRAKGVYDTLNLLRMDQLDKESIADAADEIARELCYLFDVIDVIPERILVAGLGNSELTPDSVGSECARMVRPTMHIKSSDAYFFESLECSEIAVCTPGVAAKTGYCGETLIRGLCDIIKPDAVIAIDALATRSPDRLGTTIQLSTTGVYPGSGLGNSGAALNKESLGVPVIAIGIPTVIDARMFQGEKAAKAKSGGSMFVSPKEINDIASSAAHIISSGINQAFGIY